MGFNTEDAIFIESRQSPTGSTYKIYHFKCISCTEVIKVQKGSFETHSGKCRRCCQLGEPYLFIYNELKNHRNRKVSFNLSFDEFLEIIKNNSCHYCEKELIYNTHSKVWNKSNSRAHQLDRKDNSKGYEKDNVVPCCWNCNRMKSDIYSYEEFKLLSPILKEIHKNRK